MRRLLITILTASCAAASPAGAQTATMQPSELHIGQTDRVTFRIALPAGRWTVSLQMPAFVRGHEAFGSPDPLDPYGTPFTPAGPPVAGAGASVSGGEPGTAGFGSGCRRGFDAPATPFANVTMPAGGGTLAWGFWLSKAHRWSATDYRVMFRLRGEDGRTIDVAPPSPVVRGRFGTRFRFGIRRLPRGVYHVAGTTQPPLRRGRVSLMTARARDDAGSGAPEFPQDFTRGRAAATFRTDAQGRFRYRWRPLRNRYYAVWMGSFTTPARHGDSSCPLRIDTGS